MKFRALTADDVEVRIATVKKNGVSLLLYKDARVDQNILDDTAGAENWQKKYEIIGGNLFCSVGIRVLHEDSQDREWIWKQDVGVESYTEKEKGQASDMLGRTFSLIFSLSTFPSMLGIVASGYWVEAHLHFHNDNSFLS